MNVNLREVPIRPIQLETKVQIPKEYYEHTGILGLKDVFLHLTIFKDSNQDDILSFQVTGKFLLEDARTLEEVEDPFQIEREEKISMESEICGRFLENSQNTLDILDILWENIVLEIPISFTLADDDFAEETTREKNLEIDPRLAPLQELLEKEKE